MASRDPIELSDAAKRAFALQDYGAAPEIEGVQVVELKRFTDDGGSFMELARLQQGIPASLPGFECRQVNYSEMDAGVIKAFHLHRRQTDVWFVPPGDKMLVVLLDVRAHSRTHGAQRRIVLGDGQTRLLRIPPGVAHGVKNLAAIARPHHLLRGRAVLGGSGSDRRGAAALGLRRGRHLGRHPGIG